MKTFFKMDFWVGFNFKKPLKKWTFQQKSGVLFKKPSKKTELFTLPWALFKSGVAIKWIWYTLGIQRIL